MALLVTIKANWKQELKTSLLYSAAFILVNLVLPQLTLGYPLLKFQSFAPNFLVISVIAPLAEELLFRFMIVNFLWHLRFGTIVVMGVSAALFSLFHYQAYGASLSAQNATFIGAFLFGLVAAYVAIRKRSLVPTIIMHSTFNTWLLIRRSFT